MLIAPNDTKHTLKFGSSATILIPSLELLAGYIQMLGTPWVVTNLCSFSEASNFATTMLSTFLRCLAILFHTDVTCLLFSDLQSNPFMNMMFNRKTCQSPEKGFADENVTYIEFWTYMMWQQILCTYHYGYQLHILVKFKRPEFVLPMISIFVQTCVNNLQDCQSSSIYKDTSLSFESSKSDREYRERVWQMNFTILYKVIEEHPSCDPKQFHQNSAQLQLAHIPLLLFPGWA